MGLYDTGSITVTDVTNSIAQTSINAQDTSIMPYTTSWSKWHGYYRTVPELQAIIDKTAEWACGRGIKAEEKNKQKLLDNIRGMGKDTIQTIARNLIRQGKIGGDSFAGISRNSRNEIINLKPLNPGSIEIQTDNRGMIVKYKQLNQNITGIGIEPKFIESWELDEMFHLPWNRISDETHGISTIEKLQEPILMIKEAEQVMRKVIRRNAKPIVIIEADTDDTTALTAIKTKYHQLLDNDEAMVVPKGSIILQDFKSIMSIDPLPWMNYLIKKFIIAEGVPEVILGSINSKDTEGASKILMLGFEQVVKTIQLFFEEQWMAQIGFKINLPEPPSINPLVLTDTRKTGQGSNKVNDINPMGQNK